MCRSIKTLRRPRELPSKMELEAAALQFVRKISGYRHPSKANQKAFDRAVSSIANVSERLFDEMDQGKKVEGSIASR